MFFSQFSLLTRNLAMGNLRKKIFSFSKSTLVRNFAASPNYGVNVETNPQLSGKKGLVLGVYHKKDEPNKLSDAAKEFDETHGDIFCEFLESLEHPLLLGQSISFTNIDPDFFNICLVGVGPDEAGYNKKEELDQCKENVRIAAGTGVRKLRETGVSCILVDALSDPGSAAEGAQLAVWRYEDYKQPEGQVHIAEVDLYGAGDRDDWERGIIKAGAQNIARELSDTPGNCMTPTIFAEKVGNILCPCGVQIEVRDKEWMESKGMHALLGVSKGSCEHPAVLEIGYCGGSIEEKPILLVGKGTTFNSGGISLWDSRGLEEARADMSGAAVVVATIKAAASLSLPINLRAVIPLCENLPSGMALKPGDVVYSMAGKNILVQDTGREGLLMLADAITHGQNEYKPQLVVDVATLTPQVRGCLGSGATAVFANDDDVWKEFQKAGSITGDRLWRLPLWDHYSENVTGFPEADLHNVGLGLGGTPCRSAAFLQEFVPCNPWAHLDTYGTGMMNHGEETSYLPHGRMTGRPMRTILQFLYQLSCPGQNETDDDSS